MSGWARVYRARGTPVSSLVRVSDNKQSPRGVGRTRRKKKKGTEERAEKRAGKIRRELSLFSSLEETVSRWFKRFRVSPRSPAFLLAVCFSLGRLVDPRRGWGDEEGERERKREKDFWKHARART